MKTYFTLFVLFFIMQTAIKSQEVKIALLKYSGGGDWYANPTSLPNLVKYCNQNLNTDIDPDIATVEVGSLEIYSYPFVHMTGHGNIILSPDEAENLRNYLISGGFLHVSDNYGLDPYLRRELNKVFPGIELQELPFSHHIYHQAYDFPDGLPKIHEHNDNPSQGFGLFYEGRMVCFYDYECDLGDGWESAEVHHDSPEKRMEALMMGANIIQFVFQQ